MNDRSEILLDLSFFKIAIRLARHFVVVKCFVKALCEVTREC
jgi:hypothetical protein